MEDCQAAFFAVGFDAGDAFEIDDGGAVDSDETGGVEGGFQGADRLLLQVGFAGAVEGDVIVLGFDVVELVEGDDVDFRAVLDDDAVGAVGGGALGCDFGGELAFAQAGFRALEGAVEAVGAEGFEEIVDGVGVEGAHGVLVEGGDEDDGGAGVDEFEDFEAVELGHLDVEEEEVGGVLGDGLYGFEAVGAFGGELDVGVGAEHLAQKGARQLLVVDNDGPQHHLTLYQPVRAARHLQWRSRMQFRITLSWVLLTGALCLGQEAKPPELVPETTFRVGTDLVQLNVSVFDPNWKVIRGLPQSAFTVLEDGVKQEIAIFRQEDVPVSMGLIVDNSASMRDKRERVASAALALVKASNPDDEVFLVSFSDDSDVTQGFTSKIELLEKGLRGYQPRGETAMRDAVLRGIQYLRSNAKRDKRVLIVITDGEDNASVASQQRLIEFAHQSNAIVYGVGILGAERPESAARAKQKLEELTTATGGRSWFPPDVSTIAAITPEIAHEIRNQYVVGYTPSNVTKDGKFRKVTVEVNVPGAQVRTRSGYFARPSCDQRSS